MLQRVFPIFSPLFKTLPGEYSSHACLSVVELLSSGLLFFKKNCSRDNFLSFFCSAFTSPKCSQMLDVSDMKLGLTWRQLACWRGVLSLVGKKGGETALACGQRSFIAVNYLLTRKSQSTCPTAGVLRNCLSSHPALSGTDPCTLN